MSTSVPTDPEVPVDGSGGATAAPGATVAIIGRPNVGKSTLFNRLVGRRQAIVHDQPGVTRDRIFATLALEDGDRPIELIDTGGLVPGDDPLGLSEQVFLAIEESDVLLLVVDGREGLVGADERVWETVRRRFPKPTVVVVNKGDTKVAQAGYGEFYALGLEHVILVSAEHGTGIADLFETLRELVPERIEEAADPDAPAIAIVGRPNVGKSSLINHMVGRSRVLVSPVAGTTRDPIDTLLETDQGRFRLIDTAGIRRRSQVTGAAEGFAVMFARRQMARADLVLLVIDAAAGLTTGDLAIAGEAWRLGRAVVVVCNKWDLVDDEAREKLEEEWPRISDLLGAPQRVNLSAVTGRRSDRLMPAVVETLERQRLRLGTSELNRLFEQAVARHTAPLDHGRPWKLYYATQVGVGPPTFMLFANRTLDRADTYRRYLENRVRDSLDLRGVPVRLVIRKR